MKPHSSETSLAAVAGSTAGADAGCSRNGVTTTPVTAVVGAVRLARSTVAFDDLRPNLSEFAPTEAYRSPTRMVRSSESASPMSASMYRPSSDALGMLKDTVVPDVGRSRSATSSTVRPETMASR